MPESAGPSLNIELSPRWTEAALHALDAHEYDFQEFKGSLWLSRDREVVGAFLHMLSKQISAFSNGAGGRIFIGLDDEGRIDGGGPMDLKPGGTRSWLEDIIPGTVSPSLRSFNVYEVPGAEGSEILPGSAVYVIEINPSEDAPHQSSDHRYYLRIAGKSRPMGHIHVEDVMRRTRHPRVRLERLNPFGEAEHLDTDPRGPKAQLCFRASLVNEGRTLATHVGVELVIPRPLVNGEVRSRMLADGGLTLSQDPGALTFFRYHPTPLFPGQHLQVVQLWIALHGSNAALVEGPEGLVRWRVFADDARPVEGSVALKEFRVVRRSMAWLRRKAASPSPSPARPGARKPTRSKARRKRDEPASSR